ncbi:DNA-3-methyladenine glycosylase family protein [Nocardioides insulae]|uniref:DNA-3-methyladenine glycosylase family protein n=1 Tax=Nocardioides insulae TaxID=394734 RepID=UPI000687EE45|nr:DNA-3-methyladenine glycosylase [Nocardioides insulae]
MERGGTTRSIELHRPVRLAAMLGPLRRGSGDPTYRIEGAGAGVEHWRAVRTPDGVAAWSASQDGDTVRVTAWGEGAQWALDAMPRLLGQDDEPDGFAPEHPFLREAVRRHGVPLIGATGLVMEALVPAIVEQKVTGQEAFAGYRRLVTRFGERAPGPREDLWLPPSPESLRAIPSWAWLRLPVDPARSRAVVTAARVAPSLERTLGLPGDEVERRLTSLPGIGEWTAAEVRARAHGDPDAVSFGDYHVAKDIGWALTGEPWDDERLREFLEPFRPHRARVVALVYAASGHRPRRGPRMAPRTHLPGR